MFNSAIQVSYNNIFYSIEYVNFCAYKLDLQIILIFCYHFKKIAVESHRMLVEEYGAHAFCKSQGFECFKKFKSGDFEVRTVKPKSLKTPNCKFNTKSWAIRESRSNGFQTNWIRQQEYRKTTSEMLLVRYKRQSVLHRIVTGDEK